MRWPRVSRWPTHWRKRRRRWPRASERTAWRTQRGRFSTLVVIALVLLVLLLLILYLGLSTNVQKAVCLDRDIFCGIATNFIVAVALASFGYFVVFAYGRRSIVGYLRSQAREQTLSGRVATNEARSAG